MELIIIRAIEKLGLTREAFKELYDEFDGFNSQFNKNHPEHGKEETFLTFLRNGSISLVADEGDLVTDIISRG